MRVGFKRICLVQFEDDSYGVRYGWVFYRYQDFKDVRFTWHKRNGAFDDCKTTKDKATKLFNRITERDKVLK